MSKWRLFSKEVPFLGQEVLFYTKKHGAWRGRYIEGGFCTMFCTDSFSHKGVETVANEDVLRWKPLPRSHQARKAQQ